MSLPKWIGCLCKGTVPDCWNCKASEALYIAWTTLEHFKEQEEVSPEMGVASDLAREAMRRIEALGK